MSITQFRWNTDILREHASHWIIDLAFELNDSKADTTFLSNEKGYWQRYNHEKCPDELRLVSQRIKDLVLRETGIAVLKCGSTLTSDQACLIQLMLGCEFGKNVTKTAQGDRRPLFSLQITEDSTAKGQYQGNGLRGNQIGFHTDGSGSTDREVKLLSMLCVRQARFGGQSRVANSQLAFKWLPTEVQEFLKQEFPRQNPYDSKLTLDQLMKKPIFKEIDDDGVRYMQFSYHPDRVRNGLIKTKGFLTKHEKVAFGLLEKALEKFSCDINLMANEILFLNNRVIAHDRRSFHDDPKAGRLLERFWAGAIE